MPAVHFRLADLKLLAPRILYYDEEDPDFALSANGPHLVRMIENCAEGANGELLSDALHAHVGAVLALVSPEEKNALAGYAKRVRKLECKDCGREVVCNNSHRDPQIVANGGHCIEPLKRLFDLAHTAGCDYYERYSTAKACPAMAIEFQTEPPAGALPHDVPVDYMATGACILDDRSSAVRLILNPRQTTRETVLSFLYIFFHEIICHAFQGSLSDDVPRARVSFGDNDEFAEGWMDSVAVQVLEDYLDRSPVPLSAETPPPKLPIQLRLRQDSSRIAGWYHSQRANGLAPKPTKYWGVNHHGGKVAEWVAYYVEDLVRLCGLQAGESPFWRLSFDLNTAPTTENERKNWMGGLRRGLESIYAIRQTQTELDAAIMRAPFTPAFIAYLRDTSRRPNAGRTLVNSLLPYLP